MLGVPEQRPAPADGAPAGAGALVSPRGAAPRSCGARGGSDGLRLAGRQQGPLRRLRPPASPLVRSVFGRQRAPGPRDAPSALRISLPLSPAA